MALEMHQGVDKLLTMHQEAEMYRVELMAALIHQGVVRMNVGAIEGCNIVRGAILCCIDRTQHFPFQHKSLLLCLSVQKNDWYAIKSQN